MEIVSTVTFLCIAVWILGAVYIAATDESRLRVGFPLKFFLALTWVVLVPSMYFFNKKRLES